MLAKCNGHLSDGSEIDFREGTMAVKTIKERSSSHLKKEQRDVHRSTS